MSAPREKVGAGVGYFEFRLVPGERECDLPIGVLDGAALDIAGYAEGALRKPGRPSVQPRLGGSLGRGGIAEGPCMHGRYLIGAGFRT
jgi:hypothetical protein